MHRRPRSPHFWEEAPFLRPCLALTAGIILYDSLLPPASWRIGLCIPGLATLGALIATALHRSPPRWLSGLQQVLIPTFFFTLGILAFASRDLRLQPDFPGGAPTGPTLAVVSGAPRVFGSGSSFAIELLASIDSGKSRRLKAGGRVVCYRDSSGVRSVLEGDTLMLRGTWERFKASGNPYEPDLLAAMRRKGLFFRMQCGASAVMHVGRPDPGSHRWLRRIHDACAEQLTRFIPNRRAFGLIQAMLLGDEAGFDPVLRGLYADTGIIHIVSISGSHVAMLFAVIAGLLQWIPGERGAWFRYGLGLLLVWMYVLVAGAPPSALRSAVMFSVVALSTLGKREGRGLNTLCTAAFILLLAEPAWLFAPGFQLSFAAVLSLMLFYTPLQRLVRIRKKPLRWLWQAVCASIAAEVLTAPIVIWYFHSFPLMFIPANILAGLVIGGAGLIGGLLVILCSPVPVLAAAIGRFLGWMLDHTNEGLSMMQRFSPESLRHVYFSATFFGLVSLTIILFATAWLRKLRRPLLAGLSCCCALVFMNILNTATALKQRRLIVYSNGREALIDEIRGMSHLPVAGAASDYHAAAARTALGAWREHPSMDSTYAMTHLSGKKILILRDSLLLKPKGTIPVDVLILTQQMRRLNVGDALRCFDPKEIVLAGRLSKYRTDIWRDSCAKRGIPLHDVGRTGAWQPEN